MSRPKRERKKSTHYGDFITEKEMDELGKRSSEAPQRPVTRSSVSRRAKPVVVSVGETNCTFQVNARKRKHASSLVVSALEQALPSVSDFRLFEIQDSALNEAKEWQLATVRRKPFPTAASCKRGVSSSADAAEQDPQQPPEKKKRKRNIPKLIKEYTRLPVDDNGEVIMPIVLKGLKILNLGAINYQNPNFHAKRYIWPVGFKSERPYYSMKQADVRCIYTNEIVEHHGDVRFIVKSDEDPEKPIIHSTPSGAWAEIGKRVSALKEGILGRRINTQLSGPEMFGFSYPSIAKLIQDMHGAEHCTKYERQQFVRATSDLISHKKNTEAAASESQTSTETPSVASKNDDELAELLLNAAENSSSTRPKFKEELHFVKLHRHSVPSAEKLVIRLPSRGISRDDLLDVKEKPRTPSRSQRARETREKELEKEKDKKKEAQESSSSQPVLPSLNGSMSETQEEASHFTSPMVEELPGLFKKAAGAVGNNESSRLQQEQQPKSQSKSQPSPSQPQPPQQHLQTQAPPYLPPITSQLYQDPAAADPLTYQLAQQHLVHQHEAQLLLQQQEAATQQLLQHLHQQAAAAQQHPQQNDPLAKQSSLAWVPIEAEGYYYPVEVYAVPTDGSIQLPTNIPEDDAVCFRPIGHSEFLVARKQNLHPFAEELHSRGSMLIQKGSAEIFAEAMRIYEEQTNERHY